MADMKKLEEIFQNLSLALNNLRENSPTSKVAEALSTELDAADKHIVNPSYRRKVESMIDSDEDVDACIDDVDYEGDDVKHIVNPSYRRKVKPRIEVDEDVVDDVDDKGCDVDEENVCKPVRKFRTRRGLSANAPLRLPGMEPEFEDNVDAVIEPSDACDVTHFGRKSKRGKAFDRQVDSSKLTACYTALSTVISVQEKSLRQLKEVALKLHSVVNDNLTGKVVGVFFYKGCGMLLLNINGKCCVKAQSIKGAVFNTGDKHIASLLHGKIIKASIMTPEGKMELMDCVSSGIMKYLASYFFTRENKVDFLVKLKETWGQTLSSNTD